MLSQPLAPLGSPTPRLQERLHLSPVTPHSRHVGDRSHPVSPAPSPPPPLELQKGERTSPRPYLSPQLREAEHSIDYLCHKFEALSRQLSREEQAREAAEKRGRQLAAESLEAQKYKDSPLSFFGLRESARFAVYFGSGYVLLVWECCS